MSKEQRPKSGALPQDSAAKEGWAGGHQRLASFGVCGQEFQNRDVHKSDHAPWRARPDWMKMWLSALVDVDSTCASESG
jgi:hypothetical protein